MTSSCAVKRSVLGCVCLLDSTATTSVSPPPPLFWIPTISHNTTSEKSTIFFPVDQFQEVLHSNGHTYGMFWCQSVQVSDLWTCDATICCCVLFSKTSSISGWAGLVWSSAPPVCPDIITVKGNGHAQTAKYSSLTDHCRSWWGGSRVRAWRNISMGNTVQIHSSIFLGQKVPVWVSNELVRGCDC